MQKARPRKGGGDGPPSPPRRNPVLAEIALSLGRVPIELEAHGSKLAAKAAVLEGGEEGVEVNEGPTG